MPKTNKPDYSNVEPETSPIGPMTSPLSILTGSIPAVTGAMRTVSGRTGPQYSTKQIVVAVIALAMGGFAIGVTEFAIMGLQRDARADLAINEFEGGLLISFYAFGVVLGSPVLALMGARRERKSYGMFLLGFFAVAHLLSFIAPNYEMMLVSRFLSGMPHGAYFATAALIAAHMAGPTRRARAIAAVLSGLTIANMAGVPLVVWLGQLWGWRTMFLVAALIAIGTMVAVGFAAPRQPAAPGASVASELKGLKNQRLWVGVFLAVFGFLGMFAVYSFIADIAVDLAGFSDSSLPFVTFIFGTGMVIGTFVGGWLTDKSVLYTVLGMAIAVSISMTLFGLLASVGWVMILLLLLLGAASAGLGPAMQTHLIDTAPRAPQLAATFQHSAFNASNGLGALMGGLVIDMGLGLRAPAFAGALFAVLGVVVTLYAIHLTKREGLKV
ncbi:MFS transporter [Nesterenkonia sp. NBAIMH1]|uniref:MFS transporter n=1 Tax=Nesterenkonia sp. NBAIMH1 TaxID=2600320 RepID=UPI001FEDFA1B|nr:MFS transporter [Nesterenkonia sp. NBAIMH1]